MNQPWSVQLFDRSVLKQRKLKEVTALLGPTAGLDCLDIGSDNGIISYLLRQRGGRWASADLDDQSVAAIRALVGSEVYRLDGPHLPFDENQFDRIALVDCLEHLADDAAFVREVFRVVRPGGWVVINVPHHKPGLLRRIRYALGQTDEKHGHVRPGYTIASLRALLGSDFTLETAHTYSGFFSELIDAVIVFAVSWLKRRKGESSKKGLLVTGQDMQAYQKMFKLYSLLYPLVWGIARLDTLLSFTTGYMLIGRARVNKTHQEYSYGRDVHGISDRWNGVHRLASG